MQPLQLMQLMQLMQPCVCVQGGHLDALHAKDQLQLMMRRRGLCDGGDDGGDHNGADGRVDNGDDGGGGGNIPLRVFEGLTEGEIRFPPTYKLDAGTLGRHTRTHLCTHACTRVGSSL